jgi:hypothetical protein
MGMRRTHAALVALVALSASPACKKEAPPTVEEPKTPDAEARSGPAPTMTPAAAPAEPPPGAAAAATPPASRVSESQFEVAIAPSGAYAAGKEGTVEVVLDAKPPFHVNDQYPIKFKLKESPGVKYPAPIVGKDKAKVEKMKATLPVAFVPESAGQRTVSGQFLFSVCTDENCLMEKRDLSLTVDVK